MLWPAFVVIHEHYFPGNWITRARRNLHLAPRIDYSRSNAGMKKFLGDAARTLQDEPRELGAVACRIPRQAGSQNCRRLAFQQFQDGSRRSPHSARRSKRLGAATAPHDVNPCPEFDT